VKVSEFADDELDCHMKTTKKRTRINAYFIFNQSVVDSEGRVINSWADIINRANVGIEVMHEGNAHNFPVDLADVEAPSTNG
jgi:photosystem II P680 reaction center D1 protein